MNISLTPELDTYVQQKVKTGMYHSASEVIREGLRLLLKQDQIRQARLQQLRQDVDLCAEQITDRKYTEYTTDTFKSLATDIKSTGHKILAK